MTTEEVCNLIIEVLSKVQPSEYKEITYTIVKTLGYLGVYNDSSGRRALIEACKKEDIIKEIADIWYKKYLN